jgi:hypothetical protein
VSVIVEPGIFVELVGPCVARPFSQKNCRAAGRGRVGIMSRRYVVDVLVMRLCLSGRTWVVPAPNVPNNERSTEARSQRETRVTKSAQARKV